MVYWSSEQPLDDSTFNATNETTARLVADSSTPEMLPVLAKQQDRGGTMQVIPRTALTPKQDIRYHQSIYL